MGSVPDGANGSQQSRHSSATRTRQSPRAAGRFIDPMLLLRTDALPSSDHWLYELKLDGYRAIAFERPSTVHTGHGTTSSSVSVPCRGVGPRETAARHRHSFAVVLLGIDPNDTLFVVADPA
jgi:hypothetical protein